MMGGAAMPNSDTAETAEQCATDAGAIIKCPNCREYYISGDDGVAERSAYDLAHKVWKENDRGFRGMTWEDVKRTVDSVIQDAGDCPRCSDR
jgi:hypothetical protein